METLKQIILNELPNNNYHVVHSKKEIFDDLVELYSIDVDVNLNDIKTYISKYTLHEVDTVIEPIDSLLKERKLFLELESNLTHIFTDFRNNIDEINDILNKFLGLFRHFNRKEKLFMPLLEKHGCYTFGRVVWRNDDRVRFSYSTIRKKLNRMDDLTDENIQNAFIDFKEKLRYSMDELIYLFIPLSFVTLDSHEFHRIENESPAFKYAIDIPDRDIKKEHVEYDHSKQYRFGSGYLTMKETNLILNNLPVEITFIDKNGFFKYFNNIVKESEMMFTRSEISIGRAVSNCHPPQAMSRVMQLIRDLKSKKKTEENMWFKMGDKFVYVTYKPLFDENDNYIGILETVQNIQSFRELPLNMKRFIGK